MDGLLKYGVVALVFWAVFGLALHVRVRTPNSRVVRQPWPLLAAVRFAPGGIAHWDQGALQTCGLAAALLFGITGFLLGPMRLSHPLTLGLPLGLAFLGYGMPWLLQRLERKRHRRKMEEAFPDALSLLANSLRAGLSLNQALEVVGREAAPCLAPEFQEAVRSIRLGLSAGDALEKMHQRWPHPDLELFVVAAGVCLRTGGNLAEMTSRLADTIRERSRLQARIRTLTSQGRLSGWVVGLLPLFLMAGLAYLDPEMMAAFFRHPLGWAILAAGLLLETLGAFMIRKIVAIDI